MGLCFRRPYQRLFSALSYPLCRSTFPRPHHLKEKLGVFMGWKHVLFGRVSFSRFHAPLSVLNMCL